MPEADDRARFDKGRPVSVTRRTVLVGLGATARAGARARYAAPARKGAVPAYGKMADPRPLSCAALMRALGEAVGTRAWKAFPVLLARRLCGPATARILGLDGAVALWARVLFGCGMGMARAVDTLARLLCPGLSVRRLATRIVGQRLALRHLADPARPLDLPEALLRQFEDAVRDWDTDPAASGRVNALERRFRPAPALAEQRARQSGPARGEAA